MMGSGTGRQQKTEYQKWEPEVYLNDAGWTFPTDLQMGARPSITVGLTPLHGKLDTR